MDVWRGVEALRHLEVLGLQLLSDADVSVLDHASPVPLERGFLMSAITPAGSFYFKFLPNAVVAGLRSEAAVLSALDSEVDWVPKLYDFTAGKFFISHSWPRLGMGVIGTSEIMGAVLDAASEDMLATILGHVAEMHTILARRVDVHADVELRTDYQQLVQLYLDHRELLDERGLVRAVERILDQGIVERPILPIHGDLRYENLIVQSGQLRAIIDFSDARRSMREDDLGRFWQYVVYTHGVAPSAFQGLLAGYEADTRYSVDIRNLALSIAYNTLFRYVHDRAGPVVADGLDDLVDRILTGVARGSIAELW